MPQITFEYTTNIKDPNNFKPVVLNIHKILKSHCKININNCKTRIKCIDDFLVGNGEQIRKFIHLEVKFLEGRSSEVITSLGEKLLDILINYESLVQKNPELDITLHIIDIERARYFKYASETSR
jgi:5-carboxymethyl-2-hydroxymuconate isomerase